MLHARREGGRAKLFTLGERRSSLSSVKSTCFWALPGGRGHQNVLNTLLSAATMPALFFSGSLTQRDQLLST